MLSWLASKSKLKEKKQVENSDTTRLPHKQEMKGPGEISAMIVYPSPDNVESHSSIDILDDRVSLEATPSDQFEGSELIVHTVDGDVMNYLRDFRGGGGEIEEDDGTMTGDTGDTAQSSLQVRCLITS